MDSDWLHKTQKVKFVFTTQIVFFSKQPVLILQNHPPLPSSKSLRRSECTNRRLTSSIPNSQYSLQRRIIPPSFKKTHKSSRSRHRWRRKSPFCHLCSLFSARSSSYLSPQSGWWRNRMFDEFFSKLEEKKGSGISQKSNGCCEMFRENYISCCFNGCGCHSYVWILNTSVSKCLINNKILSFFVASVAPVTIEEHMLYTTLSAVLKIPYKPLSQQQGQLLPLPSQRLFLEMTVRYLLVQLILWNAY